MKAFGSLLLRFAERWSISPGALPRLLQLEGFFPWGRRPDRASVKSREGGEPLR